MALLTPPTFLNLILNLRVAQIQDIYKVIVCCLRKKSFIDPESDLESRVHMTNKITIFFVKYYTIIMLYMYQVFSSLLVIFILFEDFYFTFTEYFIDHPIYIYFRALPYILGPWLEFQ